MTFPRNVPPLVVSLMALTPLGCSDRSSETSAVAKDGVVAVEVDIRSTVIKEGGAIEVTSAVYSHSPDSIWVVGSTPTCLLDFLLVDSAGDSALRFYNGTPPCVFDGPSPFGLGQSTGRLKATQGEPITNTVSLPVYGLAPGRYVLHPVADFHVMELPPIEHGGQPRELGHAQLSLSGIPLEIVEFPVP